MTDSIRWSSVLPFFFGTPKRTSWTILVINCTVTTVLYVLAILSLTGHISTRWTVSCMSLGTAGVFCIAYSIISIIYLKYEEKLKPIRKKRIDTQCQRLNQVWIQAIYAALEAAKHEYVGHLPKAEHSESVLNQDSNRALDAHQALGQSCNQKSPSHRLFVGDVQESDRELAEIYRNRSASAPVYLYQVFQTTKKAKDVRSKEVFENGQLTTPSSDNQHTSNILFVNGSAVVGAASSQDLLAANSHIQRSSEEMLMNNECGTNQKSPSKAIASKIANSYTTIKQSDGENYPVGKLSTENYNCGMDIENHFKKHSTSKAQSSEKTLQTNQTTEHFVNDSYTDERPMRIPSSINQ